MYHQILYQIGDKVTNVLQNLSPTEKLIITLSILLAGGAAYAGYKFGKDTEKRVKGLDYNKNIQ